jgi:hypothetical protein
MPQNHERIQETIIEENLKKKIIKFLTICMCIRNISTNAIDCYIFHRVLQLLSNRTIHFNHKIYYEELFRQRQKISNLINCDQCGQFENIIRDRITHRQRYYYESLLFTHKRLYFLGIDRLKRIKAEDLDVFIEKRIRKMKKFGIKMVSAPLTTLQI